MINLEPDGECIYLLNFENEYNYNAVEFSKKNGNINGYNLNSFTWIESDAFNNINDKFYLMLSNKDLTKFIISDKKIDHYKFMEIIKKIEFLKKIKGL